MNRYIKSFMLLALVSLATLNACKDPEAPKANVSVVNGMYMDGVITNAPVEGAIVTVYSEAETNTTAYADPDSKQIKFVKTTDAAGKCSFEFNLENILQVKAELPYHGDTLYGEGVLVLEEDKTEDEVIHLRKLKSQL